MSIVTVHTFRTSDSNIMFAIEFLLYHTGPRFGKLPIMFESWWPPFVMARRTCRPFQMFCNMLAFWITDMVDRESNSIQFGSIPPMLVHEPS